MKYPKKTSGCIDYNDYAKQHPVKDGEKVWTKVEKSVNMILQTYSVVSTGEKKGASDSAF